MSHSSLHIRSSSSSPVTSAWHKCDSLQSFGLTLDFNTHGRKVLHNHNPAACRTPKTISATVMTSVAIVTHLMSVLEHTEHHIDDNFNSSIPLIASKTNICSLQLLSSRIKSSMKYGVRHILQHSNDRFTSGVHSQRSKVDHYSDEKRRNKNQPSHILHYSMFDRDSFCLKCHYSSYFLPAYNSDPLRLLIWFQLFKWWMY